MSNRLADRRNAAGWPIKDSTPKPDPVVAIESDSPDYPDEFLDVISQPDDAWLQQVPEELRGTYLSITVPRDTAAMALNGKNRVTDLGAFDMTETDRDVLKEMRRASTTRDLGAKEAIHLWRLTEAVRLRDNEERVRQLGYYNVPCPSCGGNVYQSQLGGTYVNGTLFTGCPACMDALNQEQQRRADLANPILTARRQAVAAAFEMENGS